MIELYCAHPHCRDRAEWVIQYAGGFAFMGACEPHYRIFERALRPGVRIAEVHLPEAFMPLRVRKLVNGSQSRPVEVVIGGQSWDKPGGWGGDE